MMRDERYAVAVADAFSRVTGGKKIGVCTVMGGINPAGLQIAYGALAQAYGDSSPLLCIADGIPGGNSGKTNDTIAIDEIWKVIVNHDTSRRKAAIDRTR